MAEIKLAAPVGLPLDRVDGRLKVTGKAPYAYEYAAQGAALCGIIVPASIGKGRVAAIDVQEARNAPGVRLVLTKDNAPPQHPFGPVDLPDRFSRVVQSWDTANKAAELNDYSVCTTWGVVGKSLYLLDVLRKRLNYPDLRRKVLDMVRLYNATTILIEEKASGTQLIQGLTGELNGVVPY